MCFRNSNVKMEEWLDKFRRIAYKADLRDEENMKLSKEKINFIFTFSSLKEYYEAGLNPREAFNIELNEWAN